MKIDGSHWDENVLHAMGADRVEEVREDGQLVGYVVDPDIDVSDYDQAKASYNPPAPPVPPDAVDKLKAFLAANPDVVELITTPSSSAGTH